MVFKKTAIQGIYLLDLEPFSDDRGSFARLYAEEVFEKNGTAFKVVQSSIAITKAKGTTRGLHYQLPPRMEDKIIVCARGTAFMAVVDIRPGSLTRGRSVLATLTSDNRIGLVVPKGCANGMQALEDNTALVYYMSESYAPDLARGVRYDDPEFGIKWPLPATVVADRDKSFPLIADAGWPEF